MTVDRVFTSIPCSRALVAKVCRRSWKRAAGQPARFSTADSFFRTAVGSRGESPFLGDGNIHREVTLCRYDRCGQENAPAGGPGLGLGDHQFSPDTLDLPLYSQHPSPEIQIVPLEGQDLAPAQAGG